MKRGTVGHLAAFVVVLAVTDIAGLESQVVGQTEKPNLQARDQNSARSSPPDTTPYIRPVIPQDLMKRRLPKRRSDAPSRPANDKTALIMNSARTW
jgi:hypothetical protein